MFYTTACVIFCLAPAIAGNYQLTWDDNDKPTGDKASEQKL